MLLLFGERVLFPARNFRAVGFRVAVDTSRDKCNALNLGNPIRGYTKATLLRHSVNALVNRHQERSIPPARNGGESVISD